MKLLGKMITWLPSFCHKQSRPAKYAAELQVCLKTSEPDREDA